MSSQEPTKIHEPYSSHRPIPTVDKFISTQADRDGVSAEQEKRELMGRMTAANKKPTKELKLKGERTVVDPTTGESVVIKDFIHALPKKDSDSSSSASSSAAAAHDKQSTSYVAPLDAKVSNILFHPCPPEVELASLLPIFATLDQIRIASVASLTVAWYLCAMNSGIMSFIGRSTLFASLITAVICAVTLGKEKLRKSIAATRLDTHRVRGEAFSPPTPESTEWLNSLIRVLFPLVDPAMFVPIADMIEDILQASLPKFVQAVKIADIGLGTTPIRILSMRALPDLKGDRNYPREDWIDQGDPPHVKMDEEKKVQQDSSASIEPAKADEFEEQAGDYVNMEVSFAYSATKAKTNKERAKDIHILMEFFVGAWDWFQVPLPIWIHVEQLVGTARIRLQMVPQPPFVRNLTFTLMGVPKVEVSAIPMAKALPNVLDLPVISGFVQAGIAAACNEYVAPKSMTLNLAQILSGDGVKKDTKTVGVLMITIHHAEGLSAQDSNGTSDPYIVLAFAKFGKPLYSTRIIFEDLNPVYEETAFLLVSDDEIRSDEDVSAQLWDSDKNSADDLIGRVQIPLKDLIKNPNQSSRRVDTLKGFEDADSMKGTLTWSVGYYEKSKFLPTNEGALPSGTSENPHTDAKATEVDTEEERQALITPPDARKSSGVLSVIIHQINNLEFQNLKGVSGSERETSAGQDTDEASEQSSNLPSSYCEIVLDDCIEYKTRVKQYTSMPFFEAGTEKWLRDWTKTQVRIVVRASILREHDPILGIISVNLADLFSTSSQVSRMFTLQDGIGFGRARVSFLFKSFEVNLPKALRGWETATMQIMSSVMFEANPDHKSEISKGCTLRIDSSNTVAKISAKHSEATNGTIAWDTDSVKLPLYDKYSSLAIFEVGKDGILSIGIHAIAVLPIFELPDDEDTEVRLPVLVGKNMSNLKRNVINDQTARFHDYQIIGHISCRVRLERGLGEGHFSIDDSQTARHEFETWDRIDGQANTAEKMSHAGDDGIIDSKEQKAIDAAHDRQLHSRQRGNRQFKPIRSSIWAKDGVKSRIRSLKDKLTGDRVRDSGAVETVETEA